MWMMAIAPPKTLVDEVTDFLLSRPTPEEIIAFRLSPTLDQKLHKLLDKNRQGKLTSEERDELSTALNIDHLMTILKAKARMKLAQ